MRPIPDDFFRDILRVMHENYDSYPKYYVRSEVVINEYCERSLYSKTEMLSFVQILWLMVHTDGISVYVDKFKKGVKI